MTVRVAASAWAAPDVELLQRYLLGLVTAQARQGRNVELLGRFAGRDDGVRAGTPRASAPCVDQIGGAESDVDPGGLDAGARDGEQDGVGIGARYLVA